MEAVLGSNLGGVLKTGGKLSPQRVTRIVKQVLDSLEEAHSLGVLHRDIKPTNIMLAQHPFEKDFVKVLDFGTATTVGAAASTPLAGTPLYMAPELTQGTSASIGSDLYSLGCVAYELSVGRPPFEGESAIDTMMMHAKEPFPSLPNDLHSPALVEFIQWTTQKDPTSRLRDARTARLTLTGERQFATLPPPLFHRFGQVPAVPLKAGETLRAVEVERRDDSNRLLRAVVEAVDSPLPTFVFLTGLSGSGVSRLASDVLALDAIQRRVEVKSARCWPSKTSEGKPLANAFAEPDDGDPLSRLEMATRLWDRAKERPSLLFLDEIHLADELTLGILERWLHKGRGIPQNLTVVGTVRLHDPRTNRGFDQICGRLVGRWAQHLRVISIENPPVSQVGELVSETFGPSDQAKQILWNLTRGHLHYLTQLYHHCHQDRSARMAVATITKTTGARGPELRMPTSFRDLVIRRLASTRTESPGLHYTLLALAVLGGSARVTKLDEMAKALPDQEEGLFSLDDVADYVSLGCSLGLLVDESTGHETRVRLANDALFEVIVSSMIDSGQWQTANLKAAQTALSTQRGAFGQHSTSAFHALIGGNVAEGCRQLIQASHTARSGGDLVHAGQLLELAHLRAEAAELSPQERLQIMLLLAEIKRTSGVWGAAQDLFERALEFPHTEDDSERRLRLRLDLADVMISRGDLENAREQLSSALGAAAELERFDLEGETSFHLGKLEAEAGNPEQAQSLFQHARLLLSQQGDRDWLLKIDVALANSLLESGQNTAAQQSLSRVDESAIAQLGGTVEASFFHIRAKLALRSKDYSKAKEDLRAAVKLRQAAGEDRQLGRLIMDLAWTYFREGSYQRAARSAASAARNFAIVDYASGESAARALLIRASYQSRNFNDVIDGAEEALSLSEFVDNTVEWASTSHFACRAALRVGSSEEALRHAQNLNGHVEQHGLEKLRAAATLDLADSLFCNGRFEEARGQVEAESAALVAQPWATEAAFLRLRLAILDRPADIEAAAGLVLSQLDSVDPYADLEGRLLLALSAELGWAGCPGDNPTRLFDLSKQPGSDPAATLDYLLGSHASDQVEHARQAVLRKL